MTTPSTPPTEIIGDPQDLSYAPPRYLLPEPGRNGAWSVLRGDSGQPIAVAYTDYNLAAGILWVQQPDQVTQIDSFFRTMKQGDIPAGTAYDAAVRLPGIQFDDEQYGDMSGVIAAFNTMAQETPTEEAPT
jgi:hypothetical protein